MLGVRSGKLDSAMANYVEVNSHITGYHVYKDLRKTVHLSAIWREGSPVALRKQYSSFSVLIQQQDALLQ